MSLNTADALRQGYKDVKSRDGLTLASALFVLQLAMLATTTSWLSTSGFSLPGPSYLWGVVTIILGLSEMVVVYGAMRTFNQDDLTALSDEAFERNWLMTLINLIVGGIVFGIVVGIAGVIFFPVALWLMIGLLLWQVYVALEDQNFVEAMRSSWSATKGSKIELTVLFAAILLTGAVLQGPTTVWTTLLALTVPSTWLSGLASVIGLIISSLFAIYTVGTLVEVYKQLE
ncbi:MAG: hypothetical protein ABEJ99_00355 [Candidatus Nanohaloarchaea archaeon]